MTVDEGAARAAAAGAGFGTVDWAFLLASSAGFRQTFETWAGYILFGKVPKAGTWVAAGGVEAR